MDGTRRTVLIVDDEVSVLRSLTAALSQYGFAVELAQSGIEGIETFGRRREDIAFVLVDIVMPGMLGTEMAQKILKMDPAAKIIFMSGYPQAEPEAKAKLRFPFIEKPVHAHDLLVKIESLIGPVMAPPADVPGTGTRTDD
jgi:DNA-binding NtrC family response regulator